MLQGSARGSSLSPNNLTDGGVDTCTVLSSEDAGRLRKRQHRRQTILLMPMTIPVLPVASEDAARLRKRQHRRQTILLMPVLIFELESEDAARLR
jgi:alanine racemase